MKQKWKKPLSWLLALSMMFTMLPAVGISAKAAENEPRTDALILVAGGDVNTPVSDIENEDQGWKWEKSTSTLDGSGTLTLSNVNFEIPSEKVNPGVRAGVCLPTNTTVVLEGTNTITLTGRSYDDNDLSINMDAIFGKGITFIGSGTLEIKAQPTDSTSYTRLQGIDCSGTLTIGDGNSQPTITVIAGTADNLSQGILAEKLSLQSGSLTAIGGQASTSYGIYTRELLNIAKDFAITASASGAITNEACYFGYGQNTDYTYKTAEDHTWSKQSIENSVSGGTITEKQDGVHVTQTGSDPVGIQYKGDIPKAQPDSLYFTNATENKSGDGWTWDKASQTLTLSGLNLTVKNGAVDNNIESGIRLPDGATIELAKDTVNTISMTASHISDSDVMMVYGIYVPGDLTIKGNGKLTVNVQLPSDISNLKSTLNLTGIDTVGKLTIGSDNDKPIITAIAGNAPTYSGGIIAGSELYLLGGNLTAQGGSQVGSSSQFFSKGIAGKLMDIRNGFKVTASCGIVAEDSAACDFELPSAYDWKLDGITKNLDNGTYESHTEGWAYLRLTQTDSNKPLSFTYNAGGSITPKTYDVTVQCGILEGNTFVENSAVGTATATPASAEAGTEITMNVTENEGYQFKELHIASGNVDIVDGKFTMPAGNVTIQAIFEKIQTTPTDPGYTLDDNGKLTIKNDDGMEAWIAFAKNQTGLLSVTSVEIQDGVTYIGEGAFAGLNNIESITIPASVTSIGNKAFENCFNLATVTVLGNNPASPLGSNVFTGTKFVTDKAKGITVPNGTLSNYQNSWSDWKDYMQENGGSVTPATYTVTVTTNNGDWGSASADKTTGLKAGDTVTLTATPKSGYHFKEWQVADGKVTITGNKFTMPAGNVTIQAIFEKDSTGGSPSGSSHSSSHSSNTSYGISAPSVDNGKVTTISPSTAKKGDTVTITVTPNTGYKLDKLTVTDAQGNALKVSDKGNGKYTFTMPAGKVTVTPTFVQETTQPEQPSKFRFVDVADNAWYAESVYYAADKNMMNGIGENKFAPADTTTRGMLMTILARNAGQDTTGGTTWYQKGMEWAKAKGVSDGTNPTANITREQLVTMLYRYAGSPAASGSLDGFTDASTVSSYAVNAMQWATANGIVNGANNQLNPQGNATRAEMAAILMRFSEKNK